MKLKKLLKAVLLFAVSVIISWIIFRGYEFGMILTSSIVVFICYLLIKEFRRRWKLGIPLMVSLNKTKEQVQEHLLFLFQHGHYKGIHGLIDELNYTCRCYPEYELTEWIVFRSWYKDLVDHALSHPDIYTLKAKGGEPYYKEDDPLYDPDAPDWWENYALKIDDDDEENTVYVRLDPIDESLRQREYRKNRFGNAISLGIGFGIGQSLFGDGNGSDGNSDGNSDGGSCCSG